MEGSAGAPPQRVCPKCARISWATGPRCPYCRARFRRQGGIAPWMLAAAVAAVLLGTALMFAIAGRIADNRLNDRVDEVTKDFDASLNRLREEVRRELNGQAGTPPPQPTPTPFPTPTPSPAPEGEGAVTPTPTPSPDDGFSPDEGDPRP